MRSVLRFAPCLLALASVSAYFQVTAPGESAEWVNGQTNMISWEKGAMDGINAFDLEMTRLSEDGITYVASTIPALRKSATSLNIYIEDVPAGDDYFLLFLNSSHGVAYALSPRFSILNATDTAAAKASATVDKSVATVTISGAPNPTKEFATTFPAVSGSTRVVMDVPLLGMAVSAVAVAMGAALTLW